MENAPLRLRTINSQLSPINFSGHDEHSQTGILTSGLKPHSRLPGPALRDQWLWEFVARYSGATAPDFHGVPGRLAVAMMDKGPPGFKEQQTIRSYSTIAKGKITRPRPAMTVQRSAAFRRQKPGFHFAVPGSSNAQ